MSIKTNQNKVNGELAIRGMSDKAKKFYNESDPLEVYEYDDESGNKLYAYDGAFGYSEGLTFQELQNCFEDMQEEFDESVRIKGREVDNMRTIKFYELTEQEVRDTQYRPLDREVQELETEDDWNYKDVIENDAEYSCSLWHECRDLYIWRIEGMDDLRYIAEIKQA